MKTPLVSNNKFVQIDQPKSNGILLIGGRDTEPCNDNKCTNNKYLQKDNYLSEFETEYEKNKVRENLGISSEYTLKWGNISGYIEDQKDLFKYYEELRDSFNEDLLSKVDKDFIKGENAVTQIAYSNSAYPNMKTLEDALNTLLYKDLTVSITCIPNIKEKGEIVTSIIYSWEYNKEGITMQSFNNEVLDNNVRTFTLEGNFNQNTTGTLTASDGIKEIQASAYLKFYPAIYYGVSSLDNLNSSDIVKFNSKLQSTRNSTITVDCTNDKSNYIYICIPYEYGAASFKVGGFEGGFRLISDNFQFQKYSNTIIRYRIYKSDNGGLGSTTITIL